ncbi:response regulator [Microbacterium immunditiarum]|uniref:DNA-binding NarL/FixJ family response regulator n=1 Tax=Microbacterium immunditiarum TaxID=337480 RepID=A0A7Y9GQN6_9MICO|nr:response regulator transcription factor [Microbacterium immunditiarum]NYE20696.1 DNA-binding NarL/FixJ family response regulator [Microbacterium immunditiarum]
MSEPIRVLLVDDQELIRVGFRLVLEAEPDIVVVGEAGDGAAGAARAAALAPDVVLMDVRMPGLDGIAATERIVADSPASRVLVLTTFDLDEYAFGALEAGASGFVLKDVQRHELAAAVRAVHRGDAVLAPRVTRRMLDRLAATRRPASAGPDPAEVLTEREHEVFVAIARGRTNAEIADALFLSESTVKTHVGRILAKLGARDRVHAVIIAHRWGQVPDNASDPIAPLPD